MSGSTTLDRNALQSDLETDEGTRLMPYRDTRGNITIGTGRNLSGIGISKAENDFMLQNDMDIAINAAFGAFPWLASLPEGRQRVIVNLTFNMGLADLRGFPKFLKAMSECNWPQAAAELTNSLWFNEVGERGPRMVKRILGAL